MEPADSEAIFSNVLGRVDWRSVENNDGPTDRVGRSNITTIAVAAQMAGGVTQQRITIVFGRIIAIQTI
jgi:hypothetical protein